MTPLHCPFVAPGNRPPKWAIWLAALGLAAATVRAAPAEEFCPAAGDEPVTRALTRIRNKHRVPAIAGAIVTSRGWQAVGVVGVRKWGTHVAAILNDRWHLGSDTKAMTATLAGSLVEEGRLKWTATAADVFPDLAPAFHAEFKTVTLLQLLSHRAGLPANLNWSRFSRKDPVTEQRRQAVKQALSAKPEYPPGRQTRYSNLGYVIAGAMIEQVTGVSWEQAIQDRVFGPLGMTNAGFGGTGTPGHLDQPWGHTRAGRPAPGNGPDMDNPPVLGPAGRVHCTIQDWAKFVADQLRGARGEPALLKPATYRVLHAPVADGDHALGWLVTQRDWGGGTVLNHCGCNTMHYANAWLAPRRDFAVLVCVNQGDETAFKATDEAAWALIQLHLSRRPAAVPDR